MPVTLVVLRGNSGSGKTTVARLLQDRFGLVVVSQDVLRREVLGVSDGPGSPAVDLIAQTARFALDRGFSVVVEGILRSDIYAPMLAALAAEHRGHTHFFRFDLSFDETVRRHRTKDGTDFGEPELRRWWRGDDALPECDERVIGSEHTPQDVVGLIAATAGW
jgi:predicted kinase